MTEPRTLMLAIAATAVAFAIALGSLLVGPAIESPIASIDVAPLRVALAAARHGQTAVAE